MNCLLRKCLPVMVLLLCGAAQVFAQYDKDVFFYRGRLALSDGKYSQAIENFNVLARLDTADVKDVLAATFVLYESTSLPRIDVEEVFRHGIWCHMDFA